MFSSHVRENKTRTHFWVCTNKIRHFKAKTQRYLHPHEVILCLNLQAQRRLTEMCIPDIYSGVQVDFTLKSVQKSVTKNLLHFSDCTLHPDQSI